MLKAIAQLDLCEREHARLLEVTQRLFAREITGASLEVLDRDPALSEQVDAFAVRYTRLQDALGEKLLPTYFRLALEPVRPVRDMIDRAEQLGLITDAEAWIAARLLRNLLVHEYVQDRAALAAHLHRASAVIPLLTTTLAALKTAIAPLLRKPS
jgi:hypothetical protein